MALPFAVLSHHRSGSNFLVDALRRHPNLACLTEPLAQHLTGFVGWGLQRWRRQPPPQAGRELGSRFNSLYLRQLQLWLTKEPHAQRRGFKETRLAEKLGWFEAHVSSVKPVVLVRDPRAVTASILTHPHLVDYWIGPAQVEHLPRDLKRQARESLVARSAAIWTHRYGNLLADLAEREHVVIRLESLIRKPEELLDRLFSFLGVTSPRGYLNSIKRMWSCSGEGIYSTMRKPDDVIHGWKRFLGEFEAKKITDICGGVLHELDYRCL